MSVSINCRFYLNGNCRFGDRCRFRHPGYDYSDFGDYYVSSNQRSLIRSSSPPAVSGVSFSFNKAHAETIQSHQKPNLFSVNRFSSLSDDEEMEDGYRSHSTSPTSPRRDYVATSPTQYKWTRSDAVSDGKTYGSPRSSGDFGRPPSSPTNQPVTFSFNQQARKVAPEHAGLFKPKPTNQTAPPSPPQSFSFAPNQARQATNQNQGLFGRSSFATTTTTKPFGNAPAPSQGLFSPSSFASPQQPKTMFGRPVGPPETPTTVFGRPAAEPLERPTTMFGKPVVPQQPPTMFGQPVASSSFKEPARSGHQANSTPKSILSDSAILDGLGNTLYSLMEDLTQAERSNFTANVFDLSMIPLNPPPRELCF